MEKNQREKYFRVENDGSESACCLCRIPPFWLWARLGRWSKWPEIANSKNDEQCSPFLFQMIWNSTVHFHSIHFHSKWFETVQSIFILSISIPNGLKQYSPFTFYLFSFQMYCKQTHILSILSIWNGQNYL